jgi:hypothetical protein
MARDGVLGHAGLRSMKRALRAAGLTAIQRLALAAIGSHADAAGRAWPGEERLAAETSLTSRSVRTAVRGLEALGVVKVARRGGRLPNEYAIQVATLDGLPQVSVPNPTGTTVPADRNDSPSDRRSFRSAAMSDRNVVPG